MIIQIIGLIRNQRLIHGKGQPVQFVLILNLLNGHTGCNGGRRSAGVNQFGSDSRIIHFRNYRHTSDGISAELEKIVVDAHSLDAKHMGHGAA